MRAHQIEAIKHGVEAYNRALDLQGPEADAGSPADVQLADLRQKADEGKAHLSLVNDLVMALPQAEVDNPYRAGARGKFLATSPEQAHRLGATVLWGPIITNAYDAGDLSKTLGSWPYFIIGSRVVPGDYKRDLPKAHLLLASAAPRPHSDSRLAAISTWAAEVSAFDAASDAALIESGMTPQQVENLFDAQTGNIVVRPGRFRTGDVLGYRKKTAEGANQRIGSGGSVLLGSRAVSAVSGLDHGISAEVMDTYGVLPRLFRLAAVFGKMSVLEAALPHTIVDDGPTAMEQYVESK